MCSDMRPTECSYHITGGDCSIDCLNWQIRYWIMFAKDLFSNTVRSKQ